MNSSVYYIIACNCNIICFVDEVQQLQHEPALTGELPRMRYCLLYYKNNGSYAVREKSGKHAQIFSFGGMTCQLSQQALKSIGEKVIVKLDRGEVTVAEGKAWARSQSA
jgi:hypothetical protein